MGKDKMFLFCEITFVVLCVFMTVFTCYNINKDENRPNPELQLSYKNDSIVRRDTIHDTIYIDVTDSMARAWEKNLKRWKK